MIVKLKNKILYIDWRYKSDEFSLLKIGTTGPPYTRITKCFITFTDTITLFNKKDKLCGGAAYCRVGDIFSKDRGRKISLTRAIKDFNREDRKIIWEHYLALKKNNKEKVKEQDSA